MFELVWIFAAHLNQIVPFCMYTFHIIMALSTEGHVNMSYYHTIKYRSDVLFCSSHIDISRVEHKTSVSQMVVFPQT